MPRRHYIKRTNTQTVPTPSPWWMAEWKFGGEIEKKIFISTWGYIAHEWIERQLRRHTTSIPTVFLSPQNEKLLPRLRFHLPLRVCETILAYVENYRVNWVCVRKWRVEISVDRTIVVVVVGGKVLFVFNTTNNYSENKSIAALRLRLNAEDY